MTVLRLWLFLGLSLLWVFSPAPAAPIPPVGPLDISGTISEVQWLPEKTVKGIPRMSGTAGRDRVEPPHFLVTLVDYEGITPPVAVTMTRYLEGAPYTAPEVKKQPPFIRLKIDYPDRNYLKQGMRIRVTGYKVAGDEGGTWTTFSGIQILQDGHSKP